MDECKIWACWSYKGPGGLLLRSRWAQHYIVSLFNNLDSLFILVMLPYMGFQNTCKSFTFPPAFQKWAILIWKQHYSTLFLRFADNSRMFSKGNVKICGCLWDVCEGLCSICMRVSLKIIFGCVRHRFLPILTVKSEENECMSCWSFSRWTSTLANTDWRSKGCLVLLA